MASVILIFLFGLMIKKRLNTGLDNVKIVVEKGVDNKYLVDTRQVKTKLKDIGIDFRHLDLKGVDLNIIESSIGELSGVEKVDVYVNKWNKLIVRIIQKRPIVRVATNKDEYYLDSKGDRIEVVIGQAVRVPVATGDIEIFDKECIKRKNCNLSDVLRVANKISEDKILSALVEQIYIEDHEENVEIIIIPKIGNSRIVLGTIDNLDDKMIRLKGYYKKGIRNLGIDRYKYLDLQWDGFIYGKSSNT